jgi:TRAP transporter 4TM/12TM fusion protein
MAEKRTTKLDTAIVGVACSMVLYHLVATQYLIWSSFEHQAMHLGFALTIVFLGALRVVKRRSLWLLNLALLVGGVFVISYFLIHFDELEVALLTFTTEQVIVGIMMVIIVIEATRRAWGPVLPMVAMLLIAYFFLGHLAPEPFHHHYIEPEYVVGYLGIGLAGIFGLILSVSANIVILFVIFGGLLWVTGAIHFVLEVGKAVGRRLVSGPAQTAVVSSALLGTVTGAAVANVALTGAFTIPLMKKTGYQPETAGAVEATASTGAQITPPVMGESAFLIAAFLGIPYVRVMLAAIIPALLYFFPVFMGVEVIARKEKIPPAEIEIDRQLIITSAPMFIIPLLVIFTMLILRFTPMYAAFYGIAAMVVVSFLRKQTRLSLRTLMEGAVTGATMGAKIAVALATVGIMAQVMITTGLGIKLGGAVEALCAGHLFPALFLTMLVSILLGCGVVTPAAYTLVVIVTAPVLIRMGALPLAAHFFAFYFAIISALTPPVALASLAGASIAGANYWNTSVNAVKLALAGFILPFLIVYNPILLMEPMTSALTTLLVSMFAVPMGLICMVVGIHNHFLTEITSWERGLYILATLSLFGYCLTHSYLLFVPGALLFIGLMLLEWKKVRFQRRTKARLLM